MSRIVAPGAFLLLACIVLLWGPRPVPAQQLLSVDPGDTRFDSGVDLRETITWRISSEGGARSERGEFVNLDNNRVLEKVELPLILFADRGALSEPLRLSADKAEQWYRQGVRRLGYRRTFTGAAGTLSNRVVIDLRRSGRLAAVSAIPPKQTLTPSSRQMMLLWQLRASNFGEVNAGSASGFFLYDGCVVYATEQLLFNNGHSQVRETVALPPGLVADLLGSGIRELSYRRTFIDDGDRQRSAEVTVELLP